MSKLPSSKIEPATLPELPVTPLLPEICQTLVTQKCLVLEAEPGAGKSTLVPLALLHEPALSQQQIILLEPRRVAAKALAHYLSHLLGESVGNAVGYQIRNESKVSKATRLLIVTEGILTRKIQSDPELTGVGAVIFDEFHERSIHADIGLLLTKEVQGALRDDLAVLVMSATIDTQSISKYLNNAPVVHCPGRAYPVDIAYQPITKEQISVSIGRVIVSALQRCQGDILVFLPGQSDILRVLEWCQANLEHNIQSVALYGALPVSEQQAIIRGESTQRRVILSTNIAETSITLPKIECVIDSGLEKLSVFDAKSGLTKLTTAMISQASAEQRAGRAGRVKAGMCIRLWPESQTLSPFTPTEIERSELSDTVLTLAAWGETEPSSADWLTAPPKAHLQQAVTLNQRLGCIDSQGKITRHGQAVSAFGIGVREAHMILSYPESPEYQYAAVLVAVLLGERDVLVRADSVDMRLRIAILDDAVKGRRATANVRNKLLQQAVQQVRKLLHVCTATVETQLTETALTEVVVHGFAERVAKQSGAGYTMAMGRGVVLSEEDPMHRHQWIVVLDCDAQQQGGRIYLALPIAFSDVSSLDLTTMVCPRYANEKLSIISQQMWGGLVVSERSLTTPDAEQYQDALSILVQQQGLHWLQWNTECERWLARVMWLSQWDALLPLINETSLLAEIDNWLLAYLPKDITIKVLRKTQLMQYLQSLLTYEQQQYLDKQAPIHYQSPTGKLFPIRYDKTHAPTVALPLQAVLGEADSPKLGNGQVALRFELLSPAGRPIQTTQDLAGFWRSSYVDVAKEMRGRYPKHRWPEAPWEAEAGHSLKRR